jgi:hypothetical protein
MDNQLIPATTESELAFLVNCEVMLTVLLARHGYTDNNKCVITMEELVGVEKSGFPAIFMSVTTDGFVAYVKEALEGALIGVVYNNA